MIIKTLFVTLLSLFCLHGFAGKTYVISVGIADYKEINDLKLSEKDAADFAAYMSGRGADITLITGPEASHVNIVSALRRVAGLAREDDTVLFFFSGHGYEGGFCCWDMAALRPSSTSRYSTQAEKTHINQAYRYFGGLSYIEIQILLRNCRARTKIVIADACYSGGLRKGLKLNTSVQSARNGDVIFLLSSRMDETSLEMTEGKNGLFTCYILKGLSGEADINNDGQITISELFRYTGRNVSSYASGKQQQQHPVLWGRFNENTVIIRNTNK